MLILPFVRRIVLVLGPERRMKRNNVRHFPFPKIYRSFQRILPEEKEKFVFLFCKNFWIIHENKFSIIYYSLIISKKHRILEFDERKPYLFKSNFLAFLFDLLKVSTSWDENTMIARVKLNKSNRSGPSVLVYGVKLMSANIS